VVIGELQPSAISDETSQNVACSIVRRMVLSRTLALIGLQFLLKYGELDTEELSISGESCAKNIDFRNLANPFNIFQF
jgi:hypothetical protein